MTLERDLRAVVGDSQVLVDRDLMAPYEVDWTGRFHARARCVVRPGTPDEVAAVLRACSAAGAAVTVQGGNTGLVGGGVPAGGEVLLSLARLVEIEPVDAVAAQATLGAGVSLAAAQDHARAAGLQVGLDLASRSQASVGGLVATNAGGIRVVRYGSMRAQVAGVEVVLADGTVLSRLMAPVKDNTGYDLSQLMCGSEGTLGVLTRIRLRLVPPAGRSAVALIGLADTRAALAVLDLARRRLNALAAAEIFYGDGLALVRAQAGLPALFGTDWAAYLVLECAGGSDPEAELVALLAEAGEVGDATVAADAAGRRRLWTYRESHPEAINTAGVPVKLDVCVPLAEFAGLVDEVPAAVARVAPGARTVLFGHLSEGNLHVNVLDAGGCSDEVSEAVLELVAARHGSISSEHGVGRAKARWLGLSRTPAEIDAMRRIKAALDPAGLLNPGVLLPPPSSI